MAKQLEQAKIQVKETTPILTIIDPVTIPLERSKPKRALILVLFTFLGGFAGIGLVLILPSLANILDGTMRKLTDVSKLHQLGWHHRIEIEEGVRKMYEWYHLSDLQN